MPQMKSLRSGQSVRFWSHCGGSPLPGLIPDRFKLFWFSYDKDGSFYTGGPTVAETVQQMEVRKGKLKRVFESVLASGAKLSLHGTGVILGPKVDGTKQRGRPLEFKQSLLELTRPQLLCTHFIAPLGSYVQIFQSETFERSTDVLLQADTWWGNAVALWIIALPEGASAGGYTHAWRTRELKDGKQVTIAVKIEIAPTEAQKRPPHHLIRVNEDASRHQNWLLFGLRTRTAFQWARWRLSKLVARRPKAGA